MEDERQINRVLAYQEKELCEFEKLDMSSAEERISTSEQLLRELGYELPKQDSEKITQKLVAGLSVPTWNELCEEASASVGGEVALESLFTEDELRENSLAVRRLNEEYNQVHRLDKYDITIAVAAGLLAGAVDALFVGMPGPSPKGVKAGSLSDFIRAEFEKKFPPEEMQKLANSSASKVPYDASTNRYTREHIEGLCPYYHRLYSLGHDPLLGFIFGVADIMNGRMTTIDRTGKFVSQVMDVDADRIESDFFAAVAKQAAHLKSDMMTSMGLPVPMMGLFSMLQFGSIGEEEQTISEIVRGMYYQGYDFIHFCSMSISVLLVEIVVRVGYAIKRVKEGIAIKDAIPLNTNHEKMPKLATMLFVGHSAASAINAGKVYFAGNPLAINYAQWLAFAKYSYQQLRWGLITKPMMRDKYVLDAIDGELAEVYDDVDDLFDEVNRGELLMLPAGEGS